MQGKALAEKHCGSCHLPTSPDLLDSLTWANNALPAMAPKLGIQVWSGNSYYQESAENAAINLADWNTLIAYYATNAPKKLRSAPPPSPLLTDWSVFSVRQPAADMSWPATTTLVSFYPDNGMVYSSDARKRLFQWDSLLRPIGNTALPSPAVNALFLTDQQKGPYALLTCIGNVQPDDFSTGMVIRQPLGKLVPAADTLLAGLPRPVQSIPCDLNKDGVTDWVVCGFGHNQGGLYVFEGTSGNGFSKKTIHALPGAIQAAVTDMDNDGWPDIVALFAYADEGIILFQNDQRGGFTPKTLLRFNAVQGSTSFQLADFNGDGKQDILYTSGDNADYTRILKPYHGVYIFLNEGNDAFRQSYFYPVNGCFKAIARDFDLDGDLDIASIAFFADMKNNPSEGFIYFEQSGPLQFIAHAPPVSGYGRWTCMDAGDMDHDGDTDILLGNYSNGGEPPVKTDTNVYKHTPFILLQNNKVR